MLTATRAPLNSTPPQGVEQPLGQLGASNSCSDYAIHCTVRARSKDHTGQALTRTGIGHHPDDTAIHANAHVREGGEEPVSEPQTQPGCR